MEPSLEFPRDQFLNQQYHDYGQDDTEERQAYVERYRSHLTSTELGRDKNDNRKRKQQPNGDRSETSTINEPKSSPDIRS